MSDPDIAALMVEFGGAADPVASGPAAQQVQMLGQARYGQLSRLSHALHAVRDQYSAALAQVAARGDGPGWVTRPPAGFAKDGSWGSSDDPVVIAPETRFDPDAFTAWYVQQDGLANRAFGFLYGQSHTAMDLDQWGARVVREITFDNPSWSLGGIGDTMIHHELAAIDLNDPPELNDASAVRFDLEVGWATPAGNLHRDADWMDSAMELALVGTVAWLSAGTLGPAAAGAIGLSTASAAGAAVAAAAVGAVTSAAGGLLQGNLSVKSVLQGAMSGALTAGLSQALAPGMSALGDAGTVVLRGTVQGGVQALMGGSLRDGAVAGIASGLAEMAVGQVEAQVAESARQGTLNAGEAFQLRMAGRVVGSAIRALAAPDAAGRAFAQSLLRDVLGPEWQRLSAPQRADVPDVTLPLTQPVPPPVTQAEAIAGAPEGDRLAAVPSVVLPSTAVPSAAELPLSRAQEDRLARGATVTDLEDAAADVGSVTASAADVLRLQDGVLTLRRSARTVYIQAAPADSPAGAGPLASASLAPAPEAAERQLQAALDQLLQTADQARTAGLLVATGDPPPAEVSGGADAPSTAEGSIRALGTAEAFLAFSPAGKLLSGLASGATDWVSAPIALGREAVLTTSDVLRHLGSAATGLPDGGAGNWAPESALGRIVASEGLLGAAGWAVTGTVRGMLAPLDSLYRQDLEALGRSLPGAALAMAPLGWGSRVSAAEGLSVEELALVASGNAARSRIIDSVSVAAQPSIEAITLLDPSAVIGFRGSLASGLKHDTKLGRDLQRVAYDQDVFYLRDPVTSDLTPYQGVQGYDIDLFAISDRLASGFRAQDWFRDLGSKHEGLRATFAELDQVLRADPSMARLKPGGVEFRVFTQDEINRRIARGDRPYYFNTRQLP